MSSMQEGLKAQIFDLNNEKISMRVTNYGATIISIFVPDSQGKLADVVLGFDSVEEYMKGNESYFGCIVGRVANRIKDGRFTLDGVDHHLAINDPPNSLHGGHKGFDKALWGVLHYETGQQPSITFKYTSLGGEEGYPGEVTVTATYALTSSNTIRLDMEAHPKDYSTPVNLAQHTYWNLAGHDSGHALRHSVQIFSSKITPLDLHSVPTGHFLPVKGTAFDFLSEKKVGSSICELPGSGYDHNFVLDLGEERSGLKHAARVKDPTGSRALDIWTDAPGMQFYTGNHISGVRGKGGALYERHQGICFETQGFPNAVNQPNFPSVVVRPGETYRHTVLYEFSSG